MKRAFICGSQIEGLRGADGDAARMAQALDARGFEVELATGERASRAGILAGYDWLIARSAPGDAAVFYYAGHGYRAPLPDLPDLPGRTLRCLCPTDLRAGSEDDWRAISSWELSIKQAQLSARTANATIILDCCYAALMSRDAAAEDAVLRALPHPMRRGLAAHLAGLRATYGADVDRVAALGAPSAVRLAACAPDQSACEVRDDTGGYRGAFTGALLAVLDEIGDAALPWSAVLAAVRARVLARCANQRPEVEGPAHRYPFALASAPRREEVALAPGRHAPGAPRLATGRLTGATPGDRYGVMPMGARRYVEAEALATVELTAVAPLLSEARVCSGATALPADAVAFPLTQRAPRAPVALDAPPKVRARLADALEASRSLRPAGPDDLQPLAYLRVRRGDATVAADGAAGDLLTVEDRLGPLGPARRLDWAIDPARAPAIGPALDATLDPARAPAIGPALDATLDPARAPAIGPTLDATIGPALAPTRGPALDATLAPALDQLADLAVAAALRELEGCDGIADGELSIELSALAGGQEVALPQRGAAVGLDDRLIVRVANRGARTLYLHLASVDATGTIALLTRMAPSGLALPAAGPPWVLGQTDDGRLEGLRLHWRAGLPESSPRVEELLVIATTAPTSLLGLERGDLDDAAQPRAAASRLERLLEQLRRGESRSAPPRAGDGFGLWRLTVELHPRRGALAITPFLLDDDATATAGAREASAWRPAPPTLSPPLRVTVAGLALEPTRARADEALRLDALVCTRGRDPRESLRASTLLVPPSATTARAGKLLGAERPRWFTGRACDFLLVAVWLSHPRAPLPALPALLEQHARRRAIADALDALMYSPETTRAVAAGAAAALVAAAAELLRAGTDDCRGLYRGTFVASEQFGLERQGPIRIDAHAPLWLELSIAREPR